MPHWMAIIWAWMRILAKECGYDPNYKFSWDDYEG